VTDAADLRSGDRSSPRLYQKVKDFVLQRIASGEWAPGARIPSENEMTERLAVSRMTVNRALRELATEGAISRSQGVGSFVAVPKPQSALLEIRNIRQEVEERGHRYACLVIRLQRASATPEVARALAVPPGATVYRSTLLHQEAGAPVALEDRTVNPAFAPAYIDQDFTRINPYEYLEDLGPLDAAEHVIEAVRPAPDVRRLLQLGPHDPCLMLTRRTWSRGLVVSRARLSYPGPRYQLTGYQNFSAPAAQGAGRTVRRRNTW